jgi:hypothetical protein
MKLILRKNWNACYLGGELVAFSKSRDAFSLQLKALFSAENQINNPFNKKEKKR